MKVNILIPDTIDRKRPSWVMKIEGINDEKVGKEAFRGKALIGGSFTELEIGSLVLFYEEYMLENADHDEPYVILYRVEKNGELKTVTSVTGWNWFTPIRQKITEILKSPQMPR